MRRAYSYVRFSSPEQARGDSLRRQLALSASYCERHQLLLDDTLSLRDLGVSAFRGKNARTGALSAFLEAVRAGQVRKGSVLLIESLDRLSREEIGEALTLFIGILNAGVNVVTLAPEREYSRKSINDVAGLLEPIIAMSRAHEESATKASRLRQAWDAKRAHMSERKLTARIPGWLRLRADKTAFDVIPAAAKTVRKIFQWTIDGHGIKAIGKRLNAEGVPPVGRRVVGWHSSYVAKILRGKAVLGEYQPHVLEGGKRVPVGEAVRGYFPAIITEAVYYQAQQARDGRKNQRGPRGKHIANLFTGLLRDARDGQTFTLVDKGNGRELVLVSSGAVHGLVGSVYRSFPYAAIERAMLHFVRELRASDFSEGRQRVEADEQLAVLEGKVSALDAKLASLKRRIVEEQGYESLLDVLRQLDAERAAALASIERLRAETAGNRGNALEDTQSILDLLDKAEDVTALRMKIKTKLRRLVSEVWALVFELEGEKVCELQITLANGRRRQIFVQRDGTALSHQPSISVIVPTADLRNYRNPDYGGWRERAAPMR